MRASDMGKTERAFACALLALAAAAFFSLNLLTPILRDDYSYAFNFLTKEPIGSFGDIFESLAVHYEKVNGRLPVHFLAHWFLWMGKGAFNVINTAAFAGLTLLVYFHAYGTLREFRPYGCLAVFLGLWMLTPAFGESFLWVTGASNYLYGIALILLYLIPYRRLRGAERSVNRPWRAPLALLGGVLAGWTNENTAGALLLVLLCLLARRLAERKTVPPWFYAGLLGVAAGLCLMVLAPGELARLDGAGGAGGLAAMLRRALVITAKLGWRLWPGVLVWAALLVCFLRRKRDKKLLIEPLIFLLAGCAALYAMALSPQVPDRVWSGPLVYFLISALALWRAAGEPRVRNVRVRVGLVTLCAALALACYAVEAPKLAATSAAFAAREAEAAEQLAASRRALTLESVRGSGARFDAAEVSGDITADPEHWLNQALARYLGADSVAAN